VKNVGLIVIDSIAGVFRSENLDIKYPSRSQDFISITSKLNKLSKKYNFATICINQVWLIWLLRLLKFIMFQQVTDNPVTDTTEPCLGLAWSNVVTRRFNINRFFRSQVRTFQVVFAPDLPNKERKFKITREGLIGTE
jgi:RecA/RadA recombinase